MESIEKVTPTGIVTKSANGVEVLHELDAVICATGFDVSHRPPFPLIGRDGVSLADYWAEEPMSYLSLCASGFPNFFTFSGPNAPVGHGSRKYIYLIHTIRRAECSRFNAAAVLCSDR